MIISQIRIRQAATLKSIRKVSEMNKTGSIKADIIFYKGTAVYRKDVGNAFGALKYGLINVYGQKLGGLYDCIWDFSDDLALAFNENANGIRSYFYLRVDGTVAIDLSLTEIAFPGENHLTSNMQGKTYKVGHASFFHDGLAVVSYHPVGSAGPTIYEYIDKKGKKQLPKENGYYYSYASDFSEGIAFAHGLYGASGDIFDSLARYATPIKISGEPAFDDTKIRDESYNYYYSDDKTVFHSGYAATTRGYWIDNQGNPLVLPNDIESTGEVNNGMLIVRKRGGDGYNNYGYYNTEAKKTFVPTIYNYNQMGGYYSENLLALSDSDGKWGSVDKTGKWIITPQYDGVGSFSDGLAIAVTNDKMGYIDKQGNIVIPFMYERPENPAISSWMGTCFNFRDGFALAIKNGKCVVLRNPLTSSGTTVPTPAPTTNPPQYNGLVKGGKAVYSKDLAAEGIDNATSAYWQYFNDGQMFKDKGYKDFAYLVEGRVQYLYEKGDSINFTGGSTNAVYCWKDVTVDGKPKKLINIGVRGTENNLDWVRDFLFPSNLAQVHVGFVQNAQAMENAEDKINFITLKKSLGDILGELAKGSDEYLIFVNGHSLGGAVANYYAYLLSDRGLSANCLVGYTFAAPFPFEAGYSTVPQNYPIFNVVNADDYVPQVGAGKMTAMEIGFGGIKNGMRMGVDKVFYSDAAFRMAYYQKDGDYSINIPIEVTFGLVEFAPMMLQAPVVPVAIIPTVNSIVNYEWPRHEQATYKIIVKKNLFTSPSAWAEYSINKRIILGLSTDDLTNGFQNAVTRAAINFLRQYGYDIDGVTPKMFEDTSDRDIGIAAALKITNGTNAAQTEFSPDRKLTREEAAAMLKNLMDVIGVKYDAAAIAWTDTKDISAWATEAVNVMYNSKIMGGTDTNTLVFSPKTPYTHEQSIITFANLWEYMKK